MHIFFELISIKKAYIYSLGILSLGLIISSLEDLISWRVFTSSGILSWQVSRLAERWTTKGLIAKYLNIILNDRSFKVCIYLRLTTSICLFILCYINIISPFVLFLALFLLLLYALRSPYGLDGSYQMNLLILFSLFIGSMFGIHSKISIFCMWFVSGQLLLSYFIAGIRKLFSPVWRSGDAIRHVFSTSGYGHPFIYKLIKINQLSAILSWSVILFEIFFIIILFVNSKFLPFFFLAGFLFHLANAFFIGLNNFIFAFSATYPILFYCIQSQQLAGCFIITLAYILLPLFFIARLWTSRTKNIKIWLLQVIALGIYVFNLFLVGFWAFLGCGYFARYFLLGAFCIAVLKSCFVIKGKVLRKETNSNQTTNKIMRSIMGFACLSLVSIMSWEIIMALKGRTNPGQSIELDFPLKNGMYYITQGGNHKTINIHHPVSAQKYALDIVQLNKFGLRSKSLLAVKLSDYNIFGTDVYSPCSGTILKTVNSMRDQSPPETDSFNPAGNCVVIKQDNTDKAIILAHLLQGSVKVQEGDVIQKGQLIGKVGNSGNTSEPHLHIHCVLLDKEGDLLFNAQAVPLTFNHDFLVRNSIVISRPCVSNRTSAMEF